MLHPRDLNTPLDNEMFEGKTNHLNYCVVLFKIKSKDTRRTPLASPCPANIYLFEVNNRNIYEQIQHISLAFLLESWRRIKYV